MSRGFATGIDLESKLPIPLFFLNPDPAPFGIYNFDPGSIREYPARDMFIRKMDTVIIFKIEVESVC
eukprot:gene16798-biopygen4760